MLNLAWQEWHYIINHHWPFSMFTGEWRDEEQDMIFYSMNDASAKLGGLKSGAELAGRRGSELGWSKEELKRWADETHSVEDGGVCTAERVTLLPNGTQCIRRSTVRINL